MPERWHWIIRFNPVRSILEVFRDPIYYGKIPPASHLTVAALLAVALDLFSKQRLDAGRVGSVAHASRLRIGHTGSALGLEFRVQVGHNTRECGYSDREASGNGGRFFHGGKLRVNGWTAYFPPFYYHGAVVG